MPDQAGRLLRKIIGLDAELVERGAILRVIGIEPAESRPVARERPRDRKRPVVGGDENGDMRRIEPGQLLAEDVQINVGRGEHNVAELAVEVGAACNRISRKASIASQALIECARICTRPTSGTSASR